MRHAVAHDLDLPTARRAADKAWESYSSRFEKYNPTINWVNDHKAVVGFKAKGIKLAGELELKPNAIELELEVPFLLRPFRKRALEVIEEEILKWVGKARTGEL
jgi:hypothetical protein